MHAILLGGHACHCLHNLFASKPFLSISMLGIAELVSGWVYHWQQRQPPLAPEVHSGNKVCQTFSADNRLAVVEEQQPPCACLFLRKSCCRCQMYGPGKIPWWSLNGNHLSTLSMMWSTLMSNTSGSHSCSALTTPLNSSPE